MKKYLILSILLLIVFMNLQAKEQQDNIFYDLRTMALEVTAEQLEIEKTADTKVFGMVMDWHLGEGIATLVAYKTGDASIYLSTGGGIIGGGAYETVRQPVVKYIELGQHFLEQAKKTDSTPLPGKNEVIFYFLTNHGVFYATEDMVNIENRASRWLELFEEANEVMAELRLTADK